MVNENKKEDKNGLWVPLNFQNDNKRLEDVNEEEEIGIEITATEFERGLDDAIRISIKTYEEYYLEKKRSEIKCYRDLEGNLYFKVLGEKHIGF